MNLRAALKAAFLPIAEPRMSLAQAARDLEDEADALVADVKKRRDPRANIIDELVKR